MTGPISIGRQASRFLTAASSFCACRGCGREEFWDVERLAVITDSVILQAAVERHHPGRIRRRCRDLVHAHERLREVLRQDRVSSHLV